MGQRIGNVGLLNLLNATEESVMAYESFGNVGAVLYRTGQAHLLALLNIGNMGRAIEVPEGYGYYNGVLNIDASYLDSLDGELKLVVNGLAIIGPDVRPEKLATALLKVNIHGEIYVPAGLEGVASRIFPEGNHEVKVYEGAKPRFENGSFILSHAFLQSVENPVNLVVNGMLTLPKDLDTALFTEKIQQIQVNGMISVHEEHAPYLYKKMDTASNGVVEVIPAGYDVLKKMLRLNSRSIKSFRSKKLLTKKPLIFERDISREAFEKAVEKIDSKSFIICSEELEDLVYEKLERLETEVLSFADHFAFIEGEQQWSLQQLLSWERPVNLIVDGVLKLDNDVTADALSDKLATLDLFGEIQVQPELTGVLQRKLRVSEGRIKAKGQMQEQSDTNVQNVGELAL